MRKLVYVCKKSGSVVKVNTLAQANELKLGGWAVDEVLEPIAEKTHTEAKQFANRVKI